MGLFDTKPTSSPGLFAQPKATSPGLFTIKTLPASLGGGAYNAGAPGQLINTGHTTYAGMPPQAGMQRNDIVPVSLGGSNSTAQNLQYEPAKEAAYRDNVEKYYAAQVKSGKVALNAARTAVLNWKNTDIPGQIAYDKQFGGPQNVLSNTLKELPNAAHTVFSAINDVVEKARGVVDFPNDIRNGLIQSVQQKSLAPLGQALTVAQQKGNALPKLGDDMVFNDNKGNKIVIPGYVTTMAMGALSEGGMGEGFDGPNNLPENTPGNLPNGSGEPNTPQPTPETGLPQPTTPSPEASAASTASTDGLNESLPNPTTPNLNVNAQNLNIAPESKQLLDNLSQDLSPKTAAKVGDVMSNQEVIDFAKANPNLSMNQVSRDASLKAQAAMLEARQTLGAQMEALQNGSASTADKADIIKNFLAVKTAATDLGRSLQSMKISADPTEGSTVADIISKIAKTGASVDDIVAAAKNVDFNNYNEVTSFYRQFVKPTAGDWIDLVRYNSMLSSPLTLSNISAGNAFNIMMQPVVKTTAGFIDAAKTAVVGGEQTHFPGEGVAYTKGAIGNIGEAFNKMTDVLSGNLDPKMLDFNVPIAAEGKEGLLVKSMNIFSTLHNAMYQFFNTIAEGGSSSALDYKAAQGVTTPLPDIAAQAEADYATFRGGTMPEGQGGLLNAVDGVANAFKQWSASDNKWLAWPTKFTLPFLRISTNMAKQMVEYSPAGFATMSGSSDAITQFAKASLGTAAFAAIGTMAATGKITGAAPTVPADKNAFDASGRQPYSVQIGNTWVSYNKLPPAFSIPMLLAASYMQSQASGKNKGKMQSVLDAFGSFGKYIADQSYVKNIGDLVAAIQGDTTKGNPMDTLITNDAQQLLPFRAFSGWLAKLLDPNERQIDSSKGAIQKQVQLFMEQIPGLREQVPAKLDAAGNPIPNQNRILNAVSPFQTSQTTPQKEQTFQNYNSLKTYNSDATQQSKALTTQAQQTLTQLKGIPKDQAKAQLKQLAQTNPDLAKKVLSLITTSAKTQNLSATEQKLLTSSTEARAQFIASQKSNYSSPEEYKAYLKDLAAKKILTAATLTRLVEILKAPQKQSNAGGSTLLGMLTGAQTAHAEEVGNSYIRNNTITPNDIEEARAILFGEISNRDPKKQQLEAQTILNTAFNRMDAYRARGQEKTLTQVLQMPNQYQAYNSKEYTRYKQGKLTASDKQKLDSINATIQQVQNGSFQNNIGNYTSYSHTNDGRIYATDKPLFKA